MRGDRNKLRIKSSIETVETSMKQEKRKKKLTSAEEDEVNGAGG